MLVKVRAEGEARARVLEFCQVFRVRVADVTHQTLTIEGTGTPDKMCVAARAARRLRDRGAGPHGPRSRSRAATAGIREREAEGGEGRRGRGRVGRRRGLTGSRAGLARRREGRTTTDMATIYYEKDTDASRADSDRDRDPRLRQPGARARAEPAGLRVRRAGGAASRFEVARGRRGRRPPRARHRRRRPPRPTSSWCLLPDTSQAQGLRRRRSRRTSRTATC